MKVIGLTGGIGMGKTTVAAAFHGRDRRIAVFDADRAVHALLAPGGGAVRAIGELLPGARRHGGIDRAALRGAIAADPAVLGRLEAVLHPLVRAAERRFLHRARGRGAAVAVLDVPLLFETGADRLCDLVVVVTAPAAVQRRRVAARRAGMTEADAARLIARQMPDRERRRRADVVVPTGLARFEGVRRVRRLLAGLAPGLPPRA